jgi:type II secretion system protein C
LLWSGVALALAAIAVLTLFKLNSPLLRAFIPETLRSPQLHGIVPTTVEDPETAPRVLHPAQSGAPANQDSAQHLKVFAIHVSTTPQDNTAVLGRGAASARTYVVGAILESGAEITAIYPDRVELLRGDERFTLYTVGAEPGQEALAQAAVAAKALGSGVPRPVNAAVRPLVRVEDVVRTVPVYGDHGIEGYSVYPGDKGELFARSGLQPQDLLVSVAGQPSGDADQLAAQLQGLALGQTVQAEIKRGAQTLYVTLNGATP